MKNKTKNISKEIRVFPNAFSPKDIHKYSSSKRYQDHFNERDKDNEDSENDVLYEIWNQEQRPSKEITVANTGLTTFREIKLQSNI